MDAASVTCQDGDVSEFVFVSGRPCLDFLGTLLWRRTLRTELIDSPEALRRWIVEAGLVDAPELPSADDTAQALSLRETVYHLVSARLTGAQPPAAADIQRVNAQAAGSLPTLALRLDGTTTRTGGSCAVLSALARDAVDLLGSAEWDRVKECSNADCTRLFVDLSRGFSRRWCGMAECGNRIKAADYRRRQRTRREAVV
jgi:predicted RNA-binding Zn ribbon-like protein